MRLVVDANILVAELIRVRGRKLIVRPELDLYEEIGESLSKFWLKFPM
jgi:hypothetical protein